MQEIWETFNGLFKTAHKQGRQIEELLTRVTELERRLRDREAERTPLHLVGTCPLCQGECNEREQA